MNSGITTSWPANQSDAKLLEGGVVGLKSFENICLSNIKNADKWSTRYRDTW